MKTEQPVLITTVQATADTVKNLFMKPDGAVAGNGERALGVLNAETSANEQAPVVCVGISLVVAGAAITQGAEVQSNASGQAITLAGGESNGLALDAAAASGDIIRVLVRN